MQPDCAALLLWDMEDVIWHRLSQTGTAFSDKDIARTAPYVAPNKVMSNYEQGGEASCIFTYERHRSF